MTRGDKWLLMACALFFLLALGIIAALFVATICQAATQRERTIAFDYRITPNIQAISDSGFAAVCMRPRAESEVGNWAATRALAMGLRLYYTHEPFLRLPGQDYTEKQEPDTSLWLLAMEHDACLKDSLGVRVVFNEWGRASYVPDFSDTGFARAYGLLLRRFSPSPSGWYFDFGDTRNGLAWVRSCDKVRPEVWPTWIQGYRLMMATTASGLERWCFYGHRQPGLSCQWCDVDNEMEGVGPYYQNFHSYADALASALAMKACGKSSIIFCQRTDVPSYRRVTAGISLLADSWFHWHHYDTGWWPPRRDLEHFGLDLGTAPSPAWQAGPGVWQRMWTRGLVIVNVGTVPWRHNSGRWISPGDALVVQTRAKDGRWIRWKTNAGE